MDRINPMQSVSSSEEYNRQYDRYRQKGKPVNAMSRKAKVEKKDANGKTFKQMLGEKILQHGMEKDLEHDER